MHLYPQGVSVRPGIGSCFIGVTGDITALGVGAYIESGHRASASGDRAFDNNSANNWESESPGTTASYIGWNWSAGEDDCRAIVRRWSIQQAYNASNGTKLASTAVLEVSDDLVDWTVVDTRALNTSFGEGAGPVQTFDVAVPVLARAARLRPTALTGGGSIPVWVVAEAQFIENIV
ncbi:discoidin domain-containing protein [Pacificispira sp.]|uniref:discoidin domain-containing protein n=1 Tax=Pacificispira sp. TaxID=2888761 RepID=UPI003BAB13F5